LTRQNQTPEFQGNKMSWKPKKGSLQKPTVVVFSFQVRQKGTLFFHLGKKKN